MGMAMRIPHDVGQPHHPQRLRGALHDEVHHRTSGRPRAHPQPLARIADLHPERLLHDVERLVDEELLHPLEVAHVERLPEPEGFPDLGAHLGGDGERELSGRVVGGEIEEREDDEADRDEGGYREEETADDVADHEGGEGGLDLPCEAGRPTIMELRGVRGQSRPGDGGHAAAGRVPRRRKAGRASRDLLQTFAAGSRLPSLRLDSERLDDRLGAVVVRRTARP